MRAYGIVNGKFVKVTEESTVWATTFIHTLKLNLGESPFFANYGLPSQESVMTQIAPDFFIEHTRQQYSDKFAILKMTTKAAINPTYDAFIMTKQGKTITERIAL
jgi:hypothetical protein